MPRSVRQTKRKTKSRKKSSKKSIFVKIYFKPECRWCNLALEYLNDKKNIKKNIKIEKIDITTSDGKKKLNNDKKKIS